MKYRLSLYEGQWSPPLSIQAIRELLDGYDGEWLVVDYAFVLPEKDVAAAIELTAVSKWSDVEHVRDAIIEKFLRRFEPEFESMIEIEVEYAC